MLVLDVEASPQGGGRRCRDRFRRDRGDFEADRGRIGRIDPHQAWCRMTKAEGFEVRNQFAMDFNWCFVCFWRNGEPTPIWRWLETHEIERRSHARKAEVCRRCN